MDAVNAYKLRRYRRLIERLDGDGEWITVNGTHIHLSDEGVPDKGNPNVIAAMKDKKSKKSKSVSGGSINGIHPALEQYAKSLGLAEDPTVRTIQEEAKLVNPNFSKGGDYTTNCGSCVIAYALRRAGLDVEAIPLKNLELGVFEQVFDGFEFKQLIGYSAQGIKDNLENRMSGCPDGSIGILYAHPKPEFSAGDDSGHLFNFEKVDGKIVIIDSQDSRRDGDALLEMMELDSFWFERIDNLPITPNLKAVVKNR